MTQLQKRAYEVLNYLLHKPHNTNVIRIGIEEAKSLKRLIDNQEGFIKELQQDIADLRLENAELEKEYYEMVNKVNSLQFELECLERENDNLYERLMNR